jgi:4,5-DOPA dioxygenase extradiol
MKMPALFIGHGSPMNIIMKNGFTDSLVKLASELPRPRSILVVSAHWLTDGTYITCAPRPRLIYDFYGFPDKLYRLTYPAPGDPDEAKSISSMFKKPEVKCDTARGLDHASWAVLRHMYPAADIPVLEMSLDYSPYNGWNGQSLQYYYDLAARLGPLREKGVLIIGSGNIVHNLRVIDMNMDEEPYDWAVDFDSRIKADLLEKNHKDLLNCKDMSHAASLSVPTLDHYLPMIFTAALQGKDEALQFTFEGFQNRSVSMRCFRIG